MYSSSSASVNDSVYSEDDLGPVCKESMSIPDEQFLKYKLANFQNFNSHNNKVLKLIEGMSKDSKYFRDDVLNSQLRFHPNLESISELYFTLSDIKVKISYDSTANLLEITSDACKGGGMKSIHLNDTEDKVDYNLNIGKGLINYLWPLFDRVEVCQINCINTFKSKKDCMCIESKYLVLDRCDEMDELRFKATQANGDVNDMDFLLQKERSIVTMLALVMLAKEKPEDMCEETASKIARLLTKKHNNVLNGIPDVLQFCMIEHLYNESILSDYKSEYVLEYMMNPASYLSAKISAISDICDKKGFNIGYSSYRPGYASLITHANYINECKIGHLTSLSDKILTEKGFALCKTDGTLLKKRTLKPRTFALDIALDWRNLYDKSIFYCFDLISFKIGGLSDQALINPVNFRCINSEKVSLLRDLNYISLTSADVIEDECKVRNQPKSVVVKIKNNSSLVKVHSECLERAHIR
ncbi:hypothetical protein [Wuhan pillworm virus 1]|uniref:hypothetical protein n=1 Tax=Wuhan pillworm virus 1 TaxID=1923744 RepID=UPI00090A95F4|nr:hypothetical protein [Wuhan pillworm virus 1]APG79340.1 hypothetical protein [Wuhan pillworm virus 1]